MRIITDIGPTSLLECQEPIHVIKRENTIRVIKIQHNEDDTHHIDLACKHSQQVVYRNLFSFMDSANPEDGTANLFI
jgi:hypothetical protein